MQRSRMMLTILGWLRAILCDARAKREAEPACNCMACPVFCLGTTSRDDQTGHHHCERSDRAGITHAKMRLVSIPDSAPRN